MTLPDRGGKPTQLPDGFTIRSLEGMEEFRECVALQQRIWGEGFQERVPASLLKVLKEVGGVVAGSWWGPEGGRSPRLVGFVVGLPGSVDGELVHWSDMLGVDPDFRGRGLGEALKQHQRSVLGARGVRAVYWSFDPLERRNASLNLVRLGARVVEFVPGMYGHSDSPLHTGLDTDRLVVRWEVGKPTVGMERPALHAALPGSHSPRLLRIPRDIQALKRKNLPEARRRQVEFREALREAWESGYRITGFFPHEPAYVLEFTGDR